MFKLFYFTLTFILSIMVNEACANSLRNVKFYQVVESQKEGRLFEALTWMQGKQVRMEYWNGQELLASIIDEQTIYDYYPKYAYAIRRKLPTQGLRDRLQIQPEHLQSKDALQDFLDLVQAKVLKEEALWGKPCRLYEYVLEGFKVQLWVWLEPFFPLQSRIFLDDDVLSVLYKNPQFDIAIADEFFLLPSFVKVSNDERTTRSQTP